MSQRDYFEKDYYAVLGVSKDATFEPTAPRKEKPILIYGTSITQGACASRPGMCHTAILGRRLDRPVINLGFSGNGRMEIEVARLLAELDASREAHARRAVSGTPSVASESM